jgi:hypothetical protein
LPAGEARRLGRRAVPRGPARARMSRLPARTTAAAGATECDENIAPGTARRAQRGRAATKNRNISRKDAKARSKNQKKIPKTWRLGTWRAEYPIRESSNLVKFAQATKTLDDSSAIVVRRGGFETRPTFLIFVRFFEIWIGAAQSTDLEKLRRQRPNPSP